MADVGKLARAGKLVWRGLIVVGAGWGLASMFGLPARFDPSGLVFYTILSNLVIFLAYLGLLASALWPGGGRRGDYPPVVMGGLMAMIAMTGIIYNFVLAPMIADASDYAVDWLTNWLLHTFVPAAVFVDWLLWADARRARWWQPLSWGAAPLAYLAFALIRARVGGPILYGSRYPYFFLDVDAYGGLAVARNCLLIALVFWVAAYLLAGLGRLKSRLTAGRPSSR
jgi:hypothetical protein